MKLKEFPVFQVGDKYIYYKYKTPAGTRFKKPKTRESTIVQDCERHVVIDLGYYTESVTKATLFTKEEKLEKVG